MTANIQNLLDYSMDLIALLAPPTHTGTRRSGALNVSSVTRCEYLRKLKSSYNFQWKEIRNSKVRSLYHSQTELKGVISTHIVKTCAQAKIRGDQEELSFQVAYEGPIPKIR